MQKTFWPDDFSSWMLEPGSSICRQPRRRVDFRDTAFGKEFDWYTLLYDVVEVPQSNEILLLGPPAMNLKPFFMDAQIKALPSAESCDFEYDELDRHFRITVSAAAGTQALEIDTALGVANLPVRRNHYALFDNRRVLLARSRDNPIEWIADWALFHKEMHGADAFLLYDNQSAAYSCEELHAQLKDRTGIETIVIVSWPFKFGPGPDRFGVWDADYGSFGILEHARWRFLRDAKSVLFSDVDELVVTAAGQTVFEIAETSPSGLIEYEGVWVVGVHDLEETGAPWDKVPVPPRHRDFVYTLKPEIMRCRIKWTVVPRACPKSAQWCIHTVRGMEGPIRDDVSIRHFRQLTLSQRRLQWDVLHPDRHDRDTELEAAFDRVFK